MTYAQICQIFFAASSEIEDPSLEGLLRKAMCKAMEAGRRNGRSIHVCHVTPNW